MKVVIFDFDGTIADTIDEVLAIFNELSEKYHLDKIDFHEKNKLRQLGAKQILKLLKINVLKSFFLLLEVRKILKLRMNKIKIFEGIKETIFALKDKGYIIGILSSNSENNIKIFLNNNEINIFDFIYSRSSLFGKARHLNNILMKYKIMKSEMIYIGDEVRDIISAKKYGISMISVTWGYNTKQTLLTNNPDFIVDDPKGIIEIINNINLWNYY